MNAPTVGIKKIAGNSTAIVFNNMTRRILGFVATICIARYLPVEMFGRYILVLATMELFRSFADFGIDYIVIRRLARGENTGMVGSALKLKFATALFSIGTAQLFSLAMGYGWHFMGYLAITSLGMAFSTAAGTLATFFQAELQMRRLVILNSTAGVLLLVLVGAGIALNVSVGGLLAVGALTEGYVFSMMCWLVRRAGFRVYPEGRTDIGMRSLLAEAAPLGFGSVLVMAYFRLDIIFLGKMVGEEAVASYGVLFRLTEASLALSVGVAATFLPLLSKYLDDSTSRDKALALYEHGFKSLLAYGVLVSSAITILAEPILGFLFGARYVNAAPALAVLTWSTVFMSINLLQANAFIALNRQRALVGVNAVVLLINLTLIITLIPRFGLLGVCIATVATEGVNTLIQNILLARDLPVRRLLATFLRYLGFGTLAVGLRLAIGQSLLVSLVLGTTMVFYGLALVANEARFLVGRFHVRRFLRLIMGAN